jgi:hypothetical protein
MPVVRNSVGLAPKLRRTRDGGPELRAGLERRDLEGRAIVRAGDRLRPVSRIDGRDSLPVVRSGEGSRDLGQFDEARRCVGEAIAAGVASGERWWEAEFHRTAGEIELMAPERDAVKAQASFERALKIARAQQACSLSFARRRASPVSGAIKAAAPRRSICSRPSTADSPRASIRLTSKRPSRC